ncbi:hypothetical protein TNCV_1450411 [Trichonephila clavipes]|nr:hypothetical protein TNCV_1450411 [Trichonephila clavipes]
MESMIRLTTSASTIESPLIRNTLALKSIELPPRSAIVEYICCYLSSLSNFPADSCRSENIVLALVCISEFPTQTPDLSI